VRAQEAARLTWHEVFHVPGHIEISTAKSKTRSRRLATVCPVLEQWLAPYRGKSGPVWTKSIDRFQEGFTELCERLKIPRRRNGLRHGFVSYHFALYANENLTAMVAGNSPAMVHKNYKGLTTSTESRSWFTVAPTKGDNVIVLHPATTKLTP